MNARQEKLFKNIVEQYINLALPIGSKFLAQKYKLDISPATIRNDMMELEKDGLLYQPHISAGRIPTEEGYRYYINHYILRDKEKKSISKKHKALLDKIKKDYQQTNEELLGKQLAKKVAFLADAAAIVAFAKNNVYYTGIANLFAQPEFVDTNIIRNISLVVDHLDELINGIFDKIGEEELEIKVGSHSYFNKACTTIFTKIKGNLFGILGPMRMDYKRNIGLINYSRQLIK